MILEYVLQAYWWIVVDIHHHSPIDGLIDPFPQESIPLPPDEIRRSMPPIDR